MEQRKRRPDQLSPEYRDGLPLYRCQVCGDLMDGLFLDDDGICHACLPEADEEWLLEGLTEGDL